MPPTCPRRAKSLALGSAPSLFTTEEAPSAIRLVQKFVAEPRMNISTPTSTPCRQPWRALPRHRRRDHRRAGDSSRTSDASAPAAPSGIAPLREPRCYRVASRVARDSFPAWRAEAPADSIVPAITMRPAPTGPGRVTAAVWDMTTACRGRVPFRGALDWATVSPRSLRRNR